MHDTRKSPPDYLPFQSCAMGMHVSHRSEQPPPGKKTRRRLTLSCTHCHHIKLKCDRQRPCGSCISRGNVAWCIYTKASQQKSDLILHGTNGPQQGPHFDAALRSYRNENLTQIGPCLPYHKESELQKRLVRLESMIEGLAAANHSSPVEQKYPTPEGYEADIPSLNSNRSGAYHAGALSRTGNDSSHVGDTAYASILAEVRQTLRTSSYAREA